MVDQVKSFLSVDWKQIKAQHPDSF